MKINSTQTIQLENVRIYANHGCLEEEKKIGSEYRVDLSVEADLSKSIESDDLKDTLDYVLLNDIVAEEMKKRSKLLEHVAGRILKRINEIQPKVNSAKIKIGKVNPPMKGQMEQVSIVVEAVY